MARWLFIAVVFALLFPCLSEAEEEVTAHLRSLTRTGLPRGI